MLKLIMADIKVLGHRLWIIPLGAFILVSIISLIPNVNMPDPVRYFMIALLAPCLLIFELLNEDQKRNSDTMMMTIPVSKRVYVLSKYLTVIILSIIAIPSGWLSYILHLFIQGNEFSLVESVSFFPSMLNTMGPILIIIYFILPIYYYTKRLKTSIAIGFMIIWPVSYSIMSMMYDFFYSTFLSDDISKFIYSFFSVLIITTVIYLIIKFFFKSVSYEWIRIGWFAVILMLSIISFEILMNNLEFTHVITRLLEKLETFTGEDRVRYLTIISNYKYYISVYSISLILCITTLVITIKKSKDKFNLASVLYLSLPIIIVVLVDKIFLLLKSLFDEKGYFGFTHEYGSYEFAAIIGLIIAFIISVKVSIYLLKNNRTLK